ncbi:hypothetical protein IHB97_004832, partial [Escherichia coli]|nr:hypothetical protein [Escherichia coli]
MWRQSLRGAGFRNLALESRVIITDSLNRREVLYTEGEGGLKRVVKKEHADGSITRSEYDEAGRLKAQTDA